MSNLTVFSNDITTHLRKMAMRMKEGGSPKVKVDWSVLKYWYHASYYRDLDLHIFAGDPSTARHLHTAIMDQFCCLDVALNWKEEWMEVTQLRKVLTMLLPEMM